MLRPPAPRCSRVSQGHDADNLLKDPQGREALLTCDVWEHAYYVDRFNARAAYVAAWWHLVDWGQARCFLTGAQRSAQSNT